MNTASYSQQMWTQKRQKSVIFGNTHKMEIVTTGSASKTPTLIHKTEEGLISMPEAVYNTAVIAQRSFEQCSASELV